MKKLLDLLQRTGLRKGFFGTSRGWLAVWSGISLGRFLHKRLGKQRAVVERVVLQPGEAVEIRDTGIRREAFSK